MSHTTPRANVAMNINIYENRKICVCARSFRDVCFKDSHLLIPPYKRNVPDRSNRYLFWQDLAALRVMKVGEMYKVPEEYCFFLRSSLFFIVFSEEVARLVGVSLKPD